MISGITQNISTHVSVIKNSPFKTKIFLTAIVFLTSLLTYLIACPEWFFDGEDWGLIFKGAQCTGLKDFLDYFIHGKVNHLTSEIATGNPAALAGTLPKDSFFTVYYRPMLLAIHAIQYYFFGIQAYAYFAFIVIMHASIAALMCYLLATLVQPGIAFLCSLFFAFHPILYGWFGRIDTQQHLMNVLLMLALVIVLKKYLEQRSLGLYLLACLIFFISLLTRETLIVLPAILFLWSFLLSNRRHIALLAGFCSVICLYLFMKSITYPIIFTMPSQLPSGSSSFSITQLITTAVQFVYEFFWLQWFPWTTYEFFRLADLLIVYKCIKIIILLCVTALFATNTKKRFIIVSIMTAFMVYWPPILFAAKGGLRLFYESLPFMMLAIAYLLNYSTLMSNRLARYVICVLFSALIAINGYVVIKGMHQMMVMPKKLDTALQNLKYSYSQTLTHKPLLILSTVGSFYSCGLIQAIELYGISVVRPRYFFDPITVHLTNQATNVDQLLHVEKQDFSIRLITQQPEKLWFQVDFDPNSQHPGIITNINKSTENNHIVDLSLNFEKDFYHPDLVVMIWLFEQEKFVPLRTHV